VTKTKLLEMLFSFSNGGLKELMTFARLPSLHLREWHLKVLDYFCELRIKRNIKEAKYQREYIINEVFPDISEIAENWYDINSKLVEVVNRFIIYRNTDLKTPSTATSLAWYYFDNDLEKCVETQRDSISKYFKVSRNRTFNFHFKKYDFLHLELVNNKSVKGNSNIRLAMDALDKGYIENRLWLVCEERTREKEWQGVFNSSSYQDTSPQHKDLIFEAIWSVIKDIDFEDVVISYLQTLYIMLLKGEIDEEVLLNLYEKRTTLFEKCEGWRARTLLDYLRSLFKYQLNAGNTDYAARYVEILDLYQKNKVMLEKQTVPLEIFKNGVTTAIIAGNIEWGDAFITRYQKYMSDDIVKYSKAQIYFERDEVDEAFKLLGEISSKETSLVIGLKRLQLKIFYCNNDFEAIHSMLPSFKRYVRNRKNLPEQSRTKILNFTKYLKKLIDNKTDFDFEKATNELAASDIIWFKKIIKK